MISGRMPPGELIYSDRGEWTNAAECASRALAAAAKKQSRYRYHRNLGLVSPADPLIGQMESILARSALM